jgi:hypothetical protein
MAWGVLMVLSLVLMASAQDFDELEEEDISTTPEPISTPPPQVIQPPPSEAGHCAASPLFLALAAAAMLYACAQH